MSLKNNPISHKKYNYYFFSLIIIILFETLIKYGLSFDNKLIKIIFNSYIYISVILILFSLNKRNIEKFQKKILNLIFFIIIYGIFEILNIDDNWQFITTNLYTSLLGNVTYAPIFFVPLFMLWGLNDNSIKVFEKLIFYSLLFGILINTFFYFWDKKLIITFLLPSFFILAGFKYRSNFQKITIIVSLFLAFCYFILDNYRSGSVRIILSLIPFIFIFFYNKNFIKFLISLIIIMPIFIIYFSIMDYSLSFLELEKFYMNSNYNNLLIDTRSFLYKEFFDEFKNYELKTILFGKGAIGTYFSPYFESIYNSRTYSIGGDFYIRSISEVGIIHLLLKGGFFYLILNYLIFLLVIFKITLSKNNYIKYQIINISFFISFMIIENPPFFSILYISFWIVLGICASSDNYNMTEDDIKKNFI